MIKVFLTNAPYLLMFPRSACLSDGFISDLWYLWSDFTLCSCDKSAQWCSQSPRMLGGGGGVSADGKSANLQIIYKEECLSLSAAAGVCFLKCV